MESYFRFYVPNGVTFVRIDVILGGCLSARIVFVFLNSRFIDLSERLFNTDMIVFISCNLTERNKS